MEMLVVLHLELGQSLFLLIPLFLDLFWGSGESNSVC